MFVLFVSIRANTKKLLKKEDDLHLMIKGIPGSTFISNGYSACPDGICVHPNSCLGLNDTNVHVCSEG